MALASIITTITVTIATPTHPACTCTRLGSCTRFSTCTKLGCSQRGAPHGCHLCPALVLVGVQHGVALVLVGVQRGAALVHTSLPTAALGAHAQTQALGCLLPCTAAVNTAPSSTIQQLKEAGSGSSGILFQDREV